MIFKQTQSIQLCDVDSSNQLTLRGMLRLLQETAMEHSAWAHNGPNDTDDPDFCHWVLFQQKIQLLRRPNWNTPLLVETWSKGAKGYYALRDFRAWDEQKNLICRAASSWLQIDPVSGSIHRPSQELMEKYGTNTESVFESPLKRFPVPEEFEHEISVQIRHCDIDINGHANNLTYLDYAAQALPDNTSLQNFNTLEVIFKKAAFDSDFITCRYTPAGNDAFLTVLRSRDKELLCVFRLS